MTIQKIGHSCMLLEHEGKKLLIDPGAWAFAPIGATEPEEIGPVDVVLFTHEHTDHFDPAILKRISAMRMPRIVSHARIKELLQKEGIACEAMTAGSEMLVEGFRIRGVKADHEDLIVPKPPNIGFLIDDSFFHPGDSISFEQVACRILALPVAAPWLKEVDAIKVVLAAKPIIAIPIHDGFVKDFFLKSLHSRMKNVLAESSIEYHVLASGEKLEV